MGAFFGYGDSDFGVWASNRERDAFLDWFADNRCSPGDDKWEYCKSEAQRWTGRCIDLEDLLPRGKPLGLTPEEYSQASATYWPHVAQLLRIIESITRGEWQILGKSRAAMGWRRASPVCRLDIHPGEGIGPIRIGMRPAEVVAVFDEPQVYEDWMGGNLNDALLFHGLILHFSECDSNSPLPGSTLQHVVIHQREDAFLFDRAMTEWTKAAMLEELPAQDFAAETPPTGNVEVPGQLAMSFDENGQLIWLEIGCPGGATFVARGL